MKETNIWIALGLSAIDMLLCALVAALVLSLVLSGSTRRSSQKTAIPSDQKAIVFEASWASPMTVPTLILTGTSPKSDQPVRHELRLDRRVDRITMSDSLGDLLLPGGFMAEVIEPENRKAEVVLLKLNPAFRWEPRIVYGDTTADVGGESPRSLELTFSASARSCMAMYRCQVALGESIVVGGSSCQRDPASGACDVGEMLGQAGR